MYHFKESRYATLFDPTCYVLTRGVIALSLSLLSSFFSHPQVPFQENQGDGFPQFEPFNACLLLLEMNITPITPLSSTPYTVNLLHIGMDYFVVTLTLLLTNVVL